MKKTNTIILILLLVVVSCNSDRDKYVLEKNISKDKINKVQNITENSSDILNSISEPYNIVDYYLLLPDELILNITREDREKILDIRDYNVSIDTGIYYMTKRIDINNAFIEIVSTGDGGGTITEITYFVKSDKTRLIAVNITDWDMLTENSNLSFYIYSDENWTDVTAEVVPEINMACFSNTDVAVDNAAIRIILPQYGKTIKVELDKYALAELADYDEKYIEVEDNLFCTKFDLSWNDGTFEITNKK